jgi:hypothetical protein
MTNSLAIGAGVGKSVYQMLGDNYQRLKKVVQNEDAVVDLSKDPTYGDFGNTAKPITFNQVTNYNVINGA